jgi:hypothetical protein
MNLAIFYEENKMQAYYFAMPNKKESLLQPSLLPYDYISYHFAYVLVVGNL